MTLILPSPLCRPLRGARSLLRSATKIMIILRLLAFSALFVVAAHSEGVSIMDRYFLSGEKLQMRSAEMREGVPISKLTAANALVAYKLGDEIQVVVGASEIAITTTPWGPALIAKGASFLRVSHKGMIKLTVSSKNADKDTTITIGSDASEKIQGEFLTYEYNLKNPPEMDLPDDLKPLLERISEFLLTSPANARAEKKE